MGTTIRTTCNGPPRRSVAVRGMSAQWPDVFVVFRVVLARKTAEAKAFTYEHQSSEGRGREFESRRVRQ